MNLNELSEIYQQNPEALKEKNLMGENKALYSVVDVEGLKFLKNKIKLDETNKNFETVLNKFIKEDNIECVKYLLENGLEYTINYGNQNEKTPLFFAKSLPMLELLVKFGADPFASDEDGKTYLHQDFNYVDEDNNDIDKINFILSQGVNVDEEDLCGNTPLFFQTNVKIAEFFIEKGADLKHTNKFGTMAKTDFFKSYKKEMVQWYNAKTDDLYEQRMMEATGGNYYRLTEEDQYEINKKIKEAKYWE